MDYAAIVVLEILYMIAFLALISAGLAIVFGMMRVINLAHGEFVMLGGYATIASAKAGYVARIPYTADYVFYGPGATTQPSTP